MLDFVCSLAGASAAKTSEVTVTVKEGYINLPAGKYGTELQELIKKEFLRRIHGGPAFPHDYLTSLEALSDERPVIF
jgi:hypothetical protein